MEDFNRLWILLQPGHNLGYGLTGSSAGYPISTGNVFILFLFMTIETKERIEYVAVPLTEFLVQLLI